jgi:hypothetical protein
MYTNNPMNPKGAARIKFGQYKAWSVDQHGGSEPHEALVQFGEVTVYRDWNKDLKRTNDDLDSGTNFWINQHWGYDLARNDIQNAGAGCLIGRTRQGHRDFMAIVKQDKRYIKSNNYKFYTTIIPGDDLVKRFPIT